MGRVADLVFGLKGLQMGSVASQSLANLSSPKRPEGMLSSWAKLPTRSPVQVGSQNGLQSQYSPLAGNLKQAEVLTTKLAGQTGSALNG